MPIVCRIMRGRDKIILMSQSSGPATDHRDTTVLVVDDEPTLLALVRTMLWRAGYDVLEATAGGEALRLAAERAKPIHVLLTDILMPDMNGCELAEALQAVRPDTKVLYMSGYTDKAIVEGTGRLLGEAPLIRKPFTAYTLISKITDLLEEHSLSAS